MRADRSAAIACAVLTVAIACDASRGADAAPPPQPFPDPLQVSRGGGSSHVGRPSAGSHGEPREAHGAGGTLPLAPLPEREAAASDRTDLIEPPEGLDSMDPRACGACHRAELRDWQRSGHARAFDGALFQDEWSRRRSSWCTDCHAPRTRGVAVADPDFGARARLGVDCASCHVRGGVVIAARVSGRAPHASHVTPSFATSAACAGCHEFPEEHVRTRMVQMTMREHAASAAHDVECQRCHMPVASPHRFPGARDARLRRSALDVDASAVAADRATTLTLVLRADRAGHAVPTGDVARRLLVRARIVGAPRSERSAELGRIFTSQNGRRVETDTRVPPQGERVVTLTLPGRGREVAWSVELLTLPFGGGGGDLDPSWRHPMRAGRARVRRP